MRFKPTCRKQRKLKNDDGQASFFENAASEQVNHQNEPRQLKLLMRSKRRPSHPGQWKVFQTLHGIRHAAVATGRSALGKIQDMLPYPKSAIPPGAETNRLLEHHYKNWADMFAPRQLLALEHAVARHHGGGGSDAQRDAVMCVFQHL